MPASSFRRARHVLVLSADPVAAALLGMFVELARFVPAFARPGERPEDALARTRPLAVVLLDGALDAARSDVFFAKAARAHVPLAMFGAPGRATELAPLAEARGVPYFDFPASREALERMLGDPRALRWWTRRPDRRKPREVPPRVEVAGRDQIVFHDATGRRWSVYDRRGAERRRPTADRPVERVFVSETGEVLASVLDESEAAARSAADLSAQLARAVPT